MRIPHTKTMAAALAGLAISLVSFEAAALTELEQRGRVLAVGMCGGCHATGKIGASPRADAPVFRTLDNRLDLDKLVQRLREGLMTGHRDMPMFRFTRDDATALVAYLRSLQGP